MRRWFRKRSKVYQIHEPCSISRSSVPINEVQWLVACDAVQHDLRAHLAALRALPPALLRDMPTGALGQMASALEAATASAPQEGAELLAGLLGALAGRYWRALALTLMISGSRYRKHVHSGY